MDYESQALRLSEEALSYSIGSPERADAIARGQLLALLSVSDRVERVRERLEYLEGRVSGLSDTAADTFNAVQEVAGLVALLD